MEYKYDELGRYKAVVTLPLEDFPEMRREPDVVITCDKDNVCVAVKAPIYVLSKEGGNVIVKPSQVGDYALVSKTATVEEMLNELKGVWKTVSDMVEASMKGNINDLPEKV